MKYIFVRRIKQIDDELVDFGVVDIPEKDLASTLKLNPLWEVVSEESTDKKQVVPPEPTPVLECPLCGKPCDSELSLKAHKISHF